MRLTGCCFPSHSLAISIAREQSNSGRCGHQSGAATINDIIARVRRRQSAGVIQGARRCEVMMRSRHQEAVVREQIICNLGAVEGYIGIPS
jgi:hypothetical protein